MGFVMATEHSVDLTPIPKFIPKALGDTLTFGSLQYACEKRWDNLGAFKKPSKLIEIRYQVYSGNQSISGIQLVF